ncbi:MAG: serine protease [Bacteroidota bacterium]|nr:serine protease [Bacteroidota bacterium]
MYQKLWKDLYAGVCSINFYSDNGIRLVSLTGFKVKHYLVTDEAIYKVMKCNEVVFCFLKSDGYSLNYEFRMSFVEFEARINRLTQFENEGYALIDIEDLDMSMIPSLEVESGAGLFIGQQVAVIGYHLDQDNLSIKSGIISSFVKSPKGDRYIQFDTLIKQGNSGSPLIDVKSGKVVGVVGCRLSTASQSYENFKRIIDDNLRLLKESEGKINIMNIDPIQVLIANQNQLKQISRDIYRSITMTFGYAYELQTINNYLQESEESKILQLETVRVRV